MIENTETLSELSRTIDDLNNNKNGGISTLNPGMYSSINLKQVDDSLENFDKNISKIEKDHNDTAHEISGLVEEEDNKLILSNSQEVSMAK